MLTTYLNITVIAEWCTLIAAIILLNKKTRIWQLFIPLLLLTVVTETIGWYQSYVLKKPNNSMPYNFLMIISIFFFAYLLLAVEPMQKIKKAGYIILIFFIGFSLVNLFFLQGLWLYNSYSETIGDIILATISCYFLYTILREEFFRGLFQYEYFWLSTGLLFSSLGSVLLYIFLDSLQSYYTKTKINVYGCINYGVNVLLYTNLIIAFICRRRNTK